MNFVAVALSAMCAIVIVALVVMVMSELVAQRRVRHENARRAAQWRVDCAEARLRGEPPPAPPNRLALG